jgi:ubiquinone/menaquinone biosynthesis C-methylase UbiE
MTHASNFDSIARPYRWLEYVTFGPLLQRMRTHHLAGIRNCRNALILGDGDGRFSARLLATTPQLRATAVDLSASMLRLLRQRCASHSSRLTAYQADARNFNPGFAPDLVVTHFFLDCLTQPEVDALVARLQPTLARDAIWIVSDFRIPPGLLGPLARVCIRALYLAFRILTGLRIVRLPDHASALSRCGFTMLETHHSLFGILTTELWQA